MSRKESVRYFDARRSDRIRLLLENPQSYFENEPNWRFGYVGDEQDQED